MTTQVRYRHLPADELGPGRRVRVYEHHGCDGYYASYTDSCSGCFEFNEGLGLDKYDVDPQHNCYVGSGCEECGYTGKRRQRCFVPFDMKAFEAACLIAESEAR